MFEITVTEPLSQGFIDEEENIHPELDEISLAKKIKILQMINDHPKWTLSTIHKNGGSAFKNKSYKKKWEAQIRRGGTIFEMFSAIDVYVYNTFQEARAINKIIRSNHIKRWGIQKYLTFPDESFKFNASNKWVDKFKKRHKISSRKVVRLVSRKEMTESDSIIQAAKEFQHEIKELQQFYKPELILNTDQTAFQYELIPKRTLTNKGERIVQGFAESPTNSATHTYTVQYTIAASGQMVGDVFLCLQEKDGRLGDRVQNQLFLAPNVTITCSKSGKLTTSLYEYYVDNILVKNMSSDFLLTIDSWPGQTDPSIYEKRFGKDTGRPSCEVKIIPEKCTSICQPLDTTFHRQLKYLAKEICAHISVFESQDAIRPEDKITNRNNIIKLQSLLHHQFSAPIFQPMLKYCFISSGLIQETIKFLNAKEVCFTFATEDQNICAKCSCQRFIKCSWCREILCFSCFFYDYHTVHCSNSNENWELLKPTHTVSILNE